MASRFYEFVLLAYMYELRYSHFPDFRRMTWHEVITKWKTPTNPSQDESHLRFPYYYLAWRCGQVRCQCERPI